MLTKGAIGNLVNRYRAVLKKCRIMNVFGSLAVAGMLVMGGVGMADARTVLAPGEEKTITGERIAGESSSEWGTVYAVENGATLTLTGSDYAGNASTEGSGGVLLGTKNTAVLKVDSSSFSNNRALYDGGAISNFGFLTVTDSTFEGNRAQMEEDGSHVTDTSDMGGGAIGIGSGSYVSIDGSTFVGNISGKDGGAIATRKFYGSYDTDSPDVSLSIRNSTFSGNEAGRSVSGDPYNYNNNVTGLYESGNGGALFNTFNNTLVESSVFTGNRAINGGAIANFYDKGKTRHFGSITIADSEFSGNRAVASAGINKEFDNGVGGAVYAYTGTLATDADSCVVITGSSFTGNSAAHGGAVASRAQLEVRDSVFMGNTAAGWGGAIVNWKNASISGTTFENNVAGMVGGAIGADATSEKLDIASSVFRNNHSVYDGGAIGSYRGLTITDSVFEGNTAQLDKSDSGEWNVAVEDATAIGGGAISLGAVSETGVASIENTSFTNNVSGYNGGAIGTRMAKDAVNSAARADIAASFTGNHANGNGGAIYNTFYADNGLGKGNGVTVAGTFAGNSADEAGGAIYNDGSKDKSGTAGGVMTITNGTFTGNTAAQGGAIYNTGTLYFRGDNLFTGNVAAQGGDDIFNRGAVTVESGSTSLNSGYLQEEGSLTVRNGATLNVASLVLNGGTMLVEGTAVVAGEGATTLAPGSELTISGGALTADAGSFLDAGYAAKADMGTALVGTSGSLNLRLGGAEYTAGQYNTARDGLFGEDENAMLHFLDGRLKVEEGEKLVIGGQADPDGHVTIAGLTPVVAKEDETAENAFAVIASVPDRFVSVVEHDDAEKQLQQTSSLSVTGSRFSARGLQVAPGDAEQGVEFTVGSGSEITLVGGETGGIIVDADNRAVKTSVVVTDGGTLHLGISGNTADQLAVLESVHVGEGNLNIDGNGLDATRHAYGSLTIGHANAVMNLTSASLTADTAELSEGALNILSSSARFGELKATGGALFVDPAHVKVDSLSGDAFGSSLLVGAGSVVEIGSFDDAGSRAEEAGLNPGAFGSGFTLGSGESMLALGQAVTLGANGSIVVDAGVDKDGTIDGAPVSSSVWFGDNSLLAVDSSIASGGSSAITAGSAGGGITVKDGAKLLIAGAQAGKTYTIAEGFADSSATVKGWNGSDLIVGRLIDAVRSDGADGAIRVDTTQKSAASVFPSISIPNTLDAMMAAGQNDVNSAAAGIRFLSRAVEPTWLADGDVVPTLDGAAQLSVAGGVQASAMAVGLAPARAVQDHLSLVTNVGQKGTNLHDEGLDVWMSALYGARHVRDFSAGSLDYGYNTDFAGAVLGGDHTFGLGAGKGRVGLALNVGTGDVRSRGDFNSTKNEFDFWGVSLYGGWSLDNLNLIADIGYSAAEHELKQDIPASLGMGGRIRADVDSEIITAGVKGEYRIETGVADVVPHVGVRYLALKTDSFTTKLDQGGDLFHTDSDLQHVWQFPVGVNLSRTFETESGWKVKPQADLSVVPVAGDTKTRIDVRTPGVNASDSMQRRVMDATAFDGVFGVEVQKENVSFGLNYAVQASEHETGHGVTAAFMYRF